MGRERERERDSVDAEPKYERKAEGKEGNEHPFPK